MNRLDKFEDILNEYKGRDNGLGSTVYKEQWEEILSGFEEKYKKQLSGMDIKTQESVLRLYRELKSASQTKPDSEIMFNISKKNLFYPKISRELDTDPQRIREYCDKWRQIVHDRHKDEDWEEFVKKFK